MESNKQETSRADRFGGVGFHTNPERINRTGRPKGSRNRATLLSELADAVITTNDLSGLPTEMTGEYAVITALMRKAIEGDVPAIKEIQDTLYGKTSENLNIESPNGTMSPAVSRMADILGKIGKK